MAFVMKKATCIILIIVTFIFSCKNEKIEENLTKRLIGIRWENSDLDFIRFDSTLIFIPIKDMYLTNGAFEYSVKSDTLVIINKTVNFDNVISFQDSISYLKIKIERDSIKLELLNEGAEEFFADFKSLTFYNSDSIDRHLYYKKEDTDYLEQINRAEEDIRNGTFVHCMYKIWRFRQEKEFIELLQKSGIKYKNLGPYPDVLPIEKRNCYCEIMNYYIQKKFGKSFIDSLMKEADLLMVHNNRSKYIRYWSCDERPHLPNSRPGYNEYMSAEVDLPIKKVRKEWKSVDGEDVFAVYDPFMDIGFYIDTTGVISNFYLNFFNPELKWNKKYKDRLFNIGVKRIKEDSIWVPGKILGIKVRTDNNVRVHFERKNE